MTTSEFRHTTIHSGRRWSTSRAYLKSRKFGPGPVVRAKAIVRRVLFDNGRATGIELGVNGRAESLRVRREVLVCAGAINSPQLLMLSGIGPADHLRQLNIPVIHNAPDVGRNLHDHIGFKVHLECPKPVSTFKYLSPLCAAMAPCNTSRSAAV